MPSPILSSLVIPFSQLRHEGTQIEVEESFRQLYRPHETARIEKDHLLDTFYRPIQASFCLIPVGSKVDIRGSFCTEIQGSCDRCLEWAGATLKSEVRAFLMPEAQFSEYDKPGGKRMQTSEDTEPAEGEHEDLYFGSFDGETVDLRFLLREQLILALPMLLHCKEDCLGLCVECGGNLNLGNCRVGCPQVKVEQDAASIEEERQSQLAKALKAKLEQA